MGLSTIPKVVIWYLQNLIVINELTSVKVSLTTRPNLQRRANTEILNGASKFYKCLPRAPG